MSETEIAFSDVSPEIAREIDKLMSQQQTATVIATACAYISFIAYKISDDPATIQSNLLSMFNFILEISAHDIMSEKTIQ